MSLCTSSHTTRLADSGGESMTTTEESTLCRLAPAVAAETRFCTENFGHEKTVVTLDSFSEKVSSISTMLFSGSSLGVHVMGSTISSNSWLLESRMVSVKKCSFHLSICSWDANWHRDKATSVLWHSGVWSAFWVWMTPSALQTRSTDAICGPAQNFQIAFLIRFFNLRDLLSVLHTHCSLWCTVSLDFAIGV